MWPSILNARAHWHLLLVSIVFTVASCDQTGREAGSPSAKEAQAATVPTVGDSTDWKAVDEAMGRSGKLQPDGVYKYSMPRSDLRINVGNIAIKPALALGSWVAFEGAGGKAMAMGDLVLTETEVAPVMDKLQEMGVEQTALHNHLLHESPRVMYLHIHAQADPVKIAQAVRAALSLTRTPSAKPEGSEPPAGLLGLDTTAVAQALGHSGKVNGGVYQVSVPRAEPVRVGGMEIPPSMGVATAINFQPTGGNKAAITGDFVMTAQEVNPVLKALRGSGIEVTALHSHMLMEEPRLYFAHFWALDDAAGLTRGLRTALDKMAIKHESS